MKKFVSLLLCIALLCSVAVVAAYADGDGAAAQFADVTVVPGGSVTINMNIANNPGVAAFRFFVYDDDGLEAEFAAADYEDDSLGLTANDAEGVFFWSGAVNNYNTTFGMLTLTIPEGAEEGEYTFRVVADQGANQARQKVDIAGTTFTVTVVEKAITGVNVAIDSGVSIGVHVLTTNPDETQIVALYEEKEEFAFVADYVEGENAGEYIYYVNVSPWAMDVDFTIDFADAFDFIDDETINMESIPTTAKTIGILSYCVQIKSDDADSPLNALLADMLEFGRQAQIYKSGKATYTLPAGLVASEREWLVLDPDAEEETFISGTFGEWCVENYNPINFTQGNATAAKKFKPKSADISFGSKFVVTVNIENNGTKTAISNARVVAGGVTSTPVATGTNSGTYTYAIGPAEYDGAEFVLYASATTNNTNKAWTTSYGYLNFACDLASNGEEGSDRILTLLEYFYTYGLSVENYAASLAE